MTLPARWMWVASAGLALGAAARAQVMIGTKPYTKLGTREGTREAMVAALNGVEVTWGQWQMLSPLDLPEGAKGVEKAFPPEDELPRMLAGGPGPDLKAKYAGKGAEVEWREMPLKPDIGGEGGVAPINLADGLKGDDGFNAVGYLYRSVTAKKACEVAVLCGSDDGMRLWLNNELLVNDVREQSLDPRAHAVTLKFKTGVNHLLVKVTQGRGEWQFQMTERQEINPLAESALDWQLDEDFPDAESRFYRIATVPHPAEVALEVGGLDVLPDARGGPARPVVCTRRGEVYLVDDAYDLPPLKAKLRLFASGLQEPLGLRVRPPGSPGATTLVMAQRSELTQVTDSDSAGAADMFRTLCDSWKISGNYHEYAFGPKYDRQGNAWVTLNLAHTGGETVMGTKVPTRGWAVKIDPTGKMTKVADGLRSPDGIGMGPDGEMFYTDNQGDYVATNKLCHLKQDAFFGHQASLKFREGYGPDWKAEGKPVPEVTWPAVWFPYKKMGQSASDIVMDDSGGAFGPFAGQMFVGEQTYCEVFRVFLEKVTGTDGVAEYQGACFPFKKNFESGVHRMTMAPADASGRASMWVGMTDRGWGSTGPKRDGLQRLVWTGRVPFEIKEMRIQPDGFVLEFTRDAGSDAADPAHYRMTSYTYDYHPDYGSEETDPQEMPITSVEALNPRSVRLHMEKLRSGGMGYVHELHMKDLGSAPDAAGVREPLLHDAAYYTVLRAPLASDGVGH